VLGIIAGVLLLPLAYFFLMPLMGAMGSERNDFEQMVGLWTQISALEQQEADDGKWKQFAQSTRASAATHLQALKLKSSTPVTQNLLKIYENCLPKIYDGTAEEREAAMKEMQTFLTEASKSVQ
jgi:hypothetical protein